MSLMINRISDDLVNNFSWDSLRYEFQFMAPLGVSRQTSLIVTYD